MPDGLEGRVLRALKDNGLTLACAESCTGGLLGARLTRVAGASEAFVGGFIAYSDRVKVDVLRVDPKLLAEKGPVSREVGRAMAQGARELLGADVAVAIAGFAGPTAPDGELGRVCIALAHAGGLEEHDLHFADIREKVREGATEEALRFVLEAAPRAAKARGGS